MSGSVVALLKIYFPSVFGAVSRERQLCSASEGLVQDEFAKIDVCWKARLAHSSF